jgi:predicted GH43/DUF377 family glycosyl hydrolase
MGGSAKNRGERAAGFVPNVVFPCRIVQWDDTVLIYDCAANTSTAEKYLLREKTLRRAVEPLKHPLLDVET